MKKKFLMALMTFCMVVSLVGCGNNDTGKKDENSSQEVSTEENKVESDKADETTEEAKESQETEETEQSDENQEVVQELTIDDEYANLTVSEGFEFESNGDGTCTLTKIGTCSDAVVVIPEKSPAGDIITMIAESAFYNAEDIESIIFAGRTMEIDKKAFQFCSAEKIVFSGSNIIIGENAFSYCEDITGIIISNSVVDIDTYAFYDCGKDMMVNISNCSGVIDEKAFQSCAAVGVSIKGSTLELGENSFSYCEDITTASFEQSILEIGTYAFYDTGDDMVITFTDCDLDIDDKAFQSCLALSLTISDCETVMGENTFSYCEDLTDVTIGTGNIEIGTYSFYDCPDLVNVSIAADSEDDSISIIIDDKAFQSCGVQNVVVGKGTVELGDNAFSYCENLTNVEFKGSSLEVGDYAFYDCSEGLVISYNGSSYDAESIEEVE